MSMSTRNRTVAHRVLTACLFGTAYFTVVSPTVVNTGCFAFVLGMYLLNMLSRLEHEHRQNLDAIIEEKFTAKFGAKYTGPTGPMPGLYVHDAEPGLTWYVSGARRVYRIWFRSADKPNSSKVSTHWAEVPLLPVGARPHSFVGGPDIDRLFEVAVKIETGGNSAFEKEKGS